MSAPAPASPFGLLVSGRPVSTDFAEVVPGTRYTTLVADPAHAAHVSLFLLPGMAFPADRGITVMYAFPPFAEWTPLGVLTPSAPSATLRTGWPAALAAGAPGAPLGDGGASAPPPPPAVAMLGLAVEPLDAVASVGSALDTAEFDKLAWAQLVARDLYAYLGSFAAVTPAGERVVMPMSAVDAWLAKFSEKFRHDPLFLLKRSSL